MFDFISFIPRAIVQGIPLLLGSTGETLTEKSGNLNLGIPGIMYVGAICGVIGSFFYEQATVASGRLSAVIGIRLPLACCLLGALEPLLNPLWVLIFYGEKPGIYALIGGAVVIATVTLWSVLPSLAAGKEAAEE